MVLVKSVNNDFYNKSKTINLDEYTPYKARHIFDFYANHSEFLIELV